LSTPPSPPTPDSAERRRLAASRHPPRPWKLWGPYLAERQWGTVREDYSADGDVWRSFPHEHARSRAYRWGEDGLLGIADHQCRLAFALALWNGRDPILKERLFGLANPEGNHGEDVKELYYYLDATPTASYLTALYRYPQRAFPYGELIAGNARRGYDDPEYELLDTGILEGDRYFDVRVEYAKASPTDIGIRITATNAGPERATLWLLPTLWFRNTWAWGAGPEEAWGEPRITAADGITAGDSITGGESGVVAEHATLGRYRLDARDTAEWIFTDNETNATRLFGAANRTPHVKDAFHDWLVGGDRGAVNPARTGTKAAAVHALDLAPGGQAVVALRLRADDDDADSNATRRPFDRSFDDMFAMRIAEADAYHAETAGDLAPSTRAVVRQAAAGLVWNQQFYFYDVPRWVAGDPEQPKPPAHRDHPNHDWAHLHARDVLAVPDAWEFPWFAVWDTAFQMIAHALIDPDFAKDQLVRFLRERYQHPNGQLPAYEFNFADVNPPVHAGACRRVYEMTGRTDRFFLARVFHKLALNFTWWVNRADRTGRHLFSGGFLGLDNIGVFDRSKPLPVAGHLEQADGTAWMAHFAAEMLAIAVELAAHDPVYEDMARKFFEHYLAIVTAINTLDGTGLWDEEDGFYYDHLHIDGRMVPLKCRSMVGLVPLFAVETFDRQSLDRLPAFRRRVEWFARHRPEQTAHLDLPAAGTRERYLLSAVSRPRLERILRRVLDEAEFLSPYGIRSLSRAHAEHPFVFQAGGVEHRVAYVPGEADGGLFGGNSNWRGPIWLPMNFILIESLRRYAEYYGDSLRVECPTGSGRWCTLTEVADEIGRRVASIFLPDATGRRPCHGAEARYATDPAWRELVLFYEYFDGDTGRGCGAAHQTGWSTLVANLLIEAPPGPR
jgi:hypothetical protein